MEIKLDLLVKVDDRAGVFRFVIEQSRVNVAGPGILRIKPQPLETRTFRSDEVRVTYDVKMTRSATPRGVTISGVVHRPDGQPLPGADVVVAYPMGTRDTPAIQIENGTIKPFENRVITKTGPDGRFSLDREPDPAGQHFAIVVVHPRFYAEVDRASFEKSGTVVARPWGRIEGVVTSHNTPAARSVVEYVGDRLGTHDAPNVTETGRSTADETGEFICERVIPGPVLIRREKKPASGAQCVNRTVHVEVRAGEKDLKWTQGFLGSGTDNATAAAYHVEAIPATFLIDPDGKIAATNLRGSAIRPAVARALGTP